LLNGVSIMKHGAIKISNNIRNYLFEINDSKCQNCGWSEINEYTGKTPLEVDHIDGDSQNNSFNNLRLLCPNCHSLTKTWKNIGSRKSTRVTRNKPSSHSG
jgi:5-methylcytosine-specific restriction endonuclease McrA